jgi:hypothetical protein
MSAKQIDVSEINIYSLPHCPLTGEQVLEDGSKYFSFSGWHISWWHCPACHGWHVVVLNDKDISQDIHQVIEQAGLTPSN